MTISLLNLFVVQSTLVVIAFAALIFLLSFEQQESFSATLTARLNAQQKHALDLVIAPLQRRLPGFLATSESYLNKKIRLDPYKYGARINSSFLNAQPFFDEFSSLSLTDPMVQFVSLQGYTDTPNPTSPGKNYWSMFTIDPTTVVVTERDVAHVCLPSVYPDASACAYTTLYDVGADIFAAIYATNTPTNVQWSPPNTFYHPLLGERISLASLSIYLDFSPALGFHKTIFSLSIRVPSIRLSVAATVISPDESVAVLYFYARARCSVLGVKAPGFHEFNKTEALLLPATKIGPMWPCDATPDPVSNQIWLHAEQRCRHTPVLTMNGSVDQSCAGGATFTHTHDGEAFIVSAARDASSSTGLDLMLVQRTPRAYFHAASDRTRAIGIAIGVVVALIVVLSCVLIMWSIRKPLHQLQRDMDLAARMRCEDVVISARHLRLREMSRVVHVFLQMNDKLRKARPFLPEHLLDRGAGERSDVGASAISGDAPQTAATSPQRCNERDDDEPDDNAHDDDDDEGDLVPFSSSFVDSRTSFSSEGETTFVTPREPSAAATLLDGTTIGTILHAALRTTRVAVLAFSARNFQHIVQRQTSGHIVRIHAELATLVEGCARSHHGVVDSFHGDHFLITFNAARPCPGGTRAAARTALAIQQQVGASVMLQRALPGGCSSGLAAGQALVGNMGTRSIQRLTTISDAFSEAACLLQIHSRRLHLADCRGVPGVLGGCLFSGRSAAELEGFGLQILGCCGPSGIGASVDVRHTLKSRLKKAHNVKFLPLLGLPEKAPVATASRRGSVSAFLASLTSMGMMASSTSPQPSPRLDSSSAEGVAHDHGVPAHQHRHPILPSRRKSTVPVPTLYPAQVDRAGSFGHAGISDLMCSLPFDRSVTGRDTPSTPLALSCHRVEAPTAYPSPAAHPLDGNGGLSISGLPFPEHHRPSLSLSSVPSQRRVSLRLSGYVTPQQRLSLCVAATEDFPSVLLANHCNSSGSRDRGIEAMASSTSFDREGRPALCMLPSGRRTASEKARQSPLPVASTQMIDNAVSSHGDLLRIRVECAVYKPRYLVAVLLDPSVAAPNVGALPDGSGDQAKAKTRRGLPCPLSTHGAPPQPCATRLQGASSTQLHRIKLSQSSKASDHATGRGDEQRQQESLSRRFSHAGHASVSVPLAAHTSGGELSVDNMYLFTDKDADSRGLCHLLSPRDAACAVLLAINRFITSAFVKRDVDVGEWTRLLMESFGALNANAVMTTAISNGAERASPPPPLLRSPTNDDDDDSFVVRTHDWLVFLWDKTACTFPAVAAAAASAASSTALASDAEAAGLSAHPNKIPRVSDPSSLTTKKRQPPGEEAAEDGPSDALLSETLSGSDYSPAGDRSHGAMEAMGSVHSPMASSVNICNDFQEHNDIGGHRIAVATSGPTRQRLTVGTQSSSEVGSEVSPHVPSFEQRKRSFSLVQRRDVVADPALPTGTACGDRRSGGIHAVGTSKFCRQSHRDEDEGAEGHGVMGNPAGGLTQFYLWCMMMDLPSNDEDGMFI